MKLGFKKYGIFLLFIDIILWTTMASTPLTEQLGTPVILLQIFSALLYFPFGVIILWKLVQDLRDLRKNWLNGIYYLFAAYYCVLTVIRFINGMEAKESIYYAVVIIGSLALYLQIHDGRLAMDREAYSLNFRWILIFMIGYKIIATILATGAFGIPRIIGNPPVNNLYSTSVLTILLPFMVDSLRKQKENKITVEAILLYLAIILMATCLSRAIFFLSALVLAGLFVVKITDFVLVKRTAIVVLCAVLTVGVLAAADVGNVRYALYREIGLFGAPAVDPTDPSETVPDDKEDVYEQIERSDDMRSELLKLGIAEAGKNPLFGTGDLYYTYDLGYKTMEQTAHNFLVEAIVSFGAVGTLMLAAILLLILKNCGLLAGALRKNWQDRIYCMAAICYYFVFGLVQPSVFNTLLCPVFLVVLAYYGTVLIQSHSDQ